MKNALITGASRGLGLALARQLAQNGWGLILDARGKKALEQIRDELSPLTKIIAIQGDVTAESHRKKLLKAAQELGSLDLLVNNASLLGPRKLALFTRTSRPPSSWAAFNNFLR